LYYEINLSLKVQITITGRLGVGWGAGGGGASGKKSSWWKAIATQNQKPFGYNILLILLLKNLNFYGLNIFFNEMLF
jgi:hypothetical protein